VESERAVAKLRVVKSEKSFILKCLEEDEDGDANLYNHLHSGRFIYDHAAGVWYEWQGHYWKEDTTGRAIAGIDAVIDAYADEAKRQAADAVKSEREGKSDKAKKLHEVQKSLMKRIRALHGARRKRNVMYLATVGRGLRGDEWDRAPWLLPCINGVVDLKTGEHRPGSPDDYIKTVCPTEWRGIDDPCDLWRHIFLNQVFWDDQELIDYVQRLFGYAISGTAVEHVLPILWGGGGNGKGTLLEALNYVIGDLSYKTESELLLEQKSAKASGAPNSGVLALRGKRLVFASESDDGRRLNASRVKELTGGDTLNARGLYARHHVEFRPSHTLMLITNHKPQAAANDFALWRRIHLIPFNRTFVLNPKTRNECKIDKHLPEKLKAEASGILAWMVRGCIEWQRHGLNPPESVLAATEEYRLEEDVIGSFINDRCDTSKEIAQVRSGLLYNEYKDWADENGHFPMSMTRFGKDMKRRFARYKSDYVYYMGVSLLVD